MRSLVLFLCLSIFALSTSSEAGNSYVLAYTGPQSGAKDSNKYFTFEVPAGLKSITIRVTASRSARGAIRGAFKQVQDTNGTPVDGNPTENELGPPFHPTAFYPGAGTWSLLLHGDTFYSGLGFEFLATIDTQPFSRHAGVFTTIFEDVNFVTLTLGGAGGFTGKVYLAGVPFPIKGKFDENGDASSNEPVPFTLHSNPFPSKTGLGTNVITGNILGRAITAYHTAYKSGDTVPEAGKYTVILPRTQVSEAIPQGTGYATMIISKAGRVSLSGKLADGTSLNTSGPIFGGPNGKKQFPLYLRTLYGSKGFVSGALTLATTAASDCSGNVRWIKPDTKAVYYRTAFDTSLAAAGARYGARARGLIAVDFPAGPDNVHVAVTGGGLPANLNETATFSPFNLVTPTGPNPAKVTVKVNATAGTFSGSVLYSAANKTVKFNGVLYQNASTPQACGFFLGAPLAGTGLSGSVTIKP